MARGLTSAGETILDRKDVQRQLSLKINGTQNLDVISISLAIDRNFGTASFSFLLMNQDGKYSIDGTNEINIGDTILYEEGLINADGDQELFEQFQGIVRQRNPIVDGGKNTIRVTAFDQIIKLQELDITKNFKATTVQVTEEELSPNALPSPNESLAQIWDFSNGNVAGDPPPQFVIREKSSNLKDISQFNGFEINNISGQVTFGVPINQENFKVLATYQYFPDGLNAEDMMRDIIIEDDGYGQTPFTIADNLTETFSSMEKGATVDTMIPNFFTQDFLIKTDTAVVYNAGENSITVDDVGGFDSSGSADVNGKTFSYTSLDEGNEKFLGISGFNSTDTFPVDAVVKQTRNLAPGTVWTTKYNNISTALVIGDFTIPGGSTIKRIDLREGRIILDAAIATSSTVTLDIDYTFITIQATGIEIPFINFTFENIQNRFDAVQRIKELLPPNYIIRTRGTNKIWGHFLFQKIDGFEDTEMKMMQGLQHSEDPNVFTRVDMFGKNNNPTNVIFGEDVSFTTATAQAQINQVGGISATEVDSIPYDTISGNGFPQGPGTVTIDSEKITYNSRTGTELLVLTRGVNDTSAVSHIDDATITTDGFSSIAFNQTLVFLREEGTFDVYGTSLSQAGFISIDNFIPIVYINDVPVNNNSVFVNNSQVAIREKTTTTTRTGKKGGTSITTIREFKAIFSHSSIDPGKVVRVFDTGGLEALNIGPDESTMDYTHGIWSPAPEFSINDSIVLQTYRDSRPGITANDLVRSLTTASYHVVFSTNKVQVDYDNSEFKIERTLLSRDRDDVVAADFEFHEVVTILGGLGNLVDGNPFTQIQTVYFAEPPTGTIYAIMDIGSIQTIDTLALTHGFFKPDDTRKFDINNFYTLKSSTDNSIFTTISDSLTNFNLSGGESLLVERRELGDSFQARFFQLIIEKAEQIPFGDGVFVIAFAEFAAFKDTILKGEATLIPTVKTSAAISGGATEVPYTGDKSRFSASGTAYLDNTDDFDYTAISATEFTGVTNVTDAHVINVRISQNQESDTTVFDDGGILPKYGDKVFKDRNINPRLDTQAKVDKRAKDFQKEFAKNATKVTINGPFAPHIEIGMTIKVNDTLNNINQNYFLEAKSGDHQSSLLTLARFP